MIWVDNSLGLYQSRQQSIQFLQQHPDIREVAITNLNNKLIATSAEGQNLVAQIPTDLKASQFLISSYFSAVKFPLPLIIRQQGNIRIAVLLNNGSLIGSINNNTALFTANGRVIDGHKSLNTTSPEDVYGLTKNQFSALLTGRISDALRSEQGKNLSLIHI